VFHIVDRTLGRERLVAVDDLHEVRVVPPEVDQLAGGIDFGLVRRLAHVEHRGGVERLAILAGQQLRGLQEHDRPGVPGHPAPLRLRFVGRLDGLLHEQSIALMVLAQNVLMVVRADHVGQCAVADLFAGDDHRHVELLPEHLAQPGLQLGPLRASGPVVQAGLIDGLRYAENAVEHRFLPCLLCLPEGRTLRLLRDVRVSRVMWSGPWGNARRRPSAGVSCGYRLHSERNRNRTPGFLVRSPPAVGYSTVGNPARAASIFSCGYA